MDIQKLAGTLLSADSLQGLSKVSGASTKEVGKVLTHALPLLLDGVGGQAKNSDTSEGFAAALSQHAKADTGNLSDFLDNIDLSDGGKILGHLLGGSKDSTTKKIAKASGVSGKKTNTILEAVAPLLMSLLGKQTDEDDDKDSGIGNLIGTLLSNVDVGELLTSLLTDSGSKKKKSTKSNGLGDVVGSLLKKLLK